ncbi:tRNA (guanine(37)-N1)-methyltransferase isoform X1 [Adelges cooleyi]|uniref:tRNA (guanine(37)-N1)-methyltransferase isoform X1 n=1 Tax=Adelges cooleyi TaxID=133065 RepID=UPI0021805AB6|nr:tRNA (guanine(37)-N1)-methyltransferase isoform X1 [Adelges cooleyi]
MNVLLPPTVVRGMKIFDINKFTKLISVPAIEVDTQNIASASKILKNQLLKFTNFKSIRDSGSNNYKRVFLLNPLKVRSFDDLNLPFASPEHFSHTDVKLTYDNWKHDEILRAILPESSMLTSYSAIGSIVHVNLKPELLEYKNVIGQVLKDKIKGCKSVVNKTDNINNIFRNFEFEVLSGSSDLQTSFKENKCIFELDFSEVYWNPRLCTEHERILEKLNAGDLLYDVFAGIGPFSIPASKRGCTVLANDLNPNCCKWLNVNKKLNRIKDDRLTIINKDGSRFIIEDLKAHLILYSKTLTNDNDNKVHVTMNLPAIGIEFVKYFNNLFEWDEISDSFLPILHIYTFVKTNESYETGLHLVMAEHNIKEEDAQEIIRVRNVAPNKEMIRITLQTTKEMLCKSSVKRKTEEQENENPKKTK